MNDEVLLQLALAKQHVHHARFAETPRQAVVDGYSAVVAMLSALLTHSGDEPPKNHKLKFDTARQSFPKAFAPEIVHLDKSWTFSPGADWAALKFITRNGARVRLGEYVQIVVRDAGSVLVHAYDGGIDHLHRRVMTGSKRIHDLVSDASPPPPNEAIVIIAGGAGTIGG